MKFIYIFWASKFTHGVQNVSPMKKEICTFF